MCENVGYSKTSAFQNVPRPAPTFEFLKSDKTPDVYILPVYFFSFIVGE